MRLIDPVRIEDPQFPAAIPCIVADEIACQLDELPGDNYDVSFDAESYGIVAPPFDSFFVEAETVVHHDAGAQMFQRGLLFEVWDTNLLKEWKALYDARWVYVMTPYLYQDSLALAGGGRRRPPVVESARGAMLRLYGLTRTNGRIFLHQIFRAKFRDALRQTNLFSQVPTAAWQTDWVVHCQPVGTGLAALKYLAPYIFRVAISNRRIIKVADDKVTFRYRATDTGQWRTCTLDALEFIRRFLQHVLPKGFVKVRYYGLFSPGNRRHLPAIRALLIAPDAQQPVDTTRPQVETLSRPEEAKDLSPSNLVRRCPTCGGLMRLAQRLKPRARCPP